MNPITNKFENLSFVRDVFGSQLIRPNGEPVPKHWTVLKKGENIVIKNYTFKVAHIGESHLLLEPVGVPMIGEKP